ncbi:MAG: hypothetical protein NVSMB9_00740 [Isosphaeraceae bacterium]
MEAQDRVAGLSEEHSPQPMMNRDGLRSILSNLNSELCRPLISLRMGFIRLLGDSPQAISLDQRNHLLAMVVICDDLLELTRSSLDYAGLARESDLSPMANTYSGP